MPFDGVNTADGTVCVVAYEVDAAMVSSAVDATRAALTGEWGKLKLVERRKLLAAIADGIEARVDDILEAEVADTGKREAMASHVNIPRGAAQCFDRMLRNGHSGQPGSHQLRDPAARWVMAYQTVMHSTTITSTFVKAGA
ncbi:MAG: aldehyde dehydrogenase family protein [Haliea sp.]